MTLFSHTKVRKTCQQHEIIPIKEIKGDLGQLSQQRILAEGIESWIGLSGCHPGFFFVCFCFFFLHFAFISVSKWCILSGLSLLISKSYQIELSKRRKQEVGKAHGMVSVLQDSWRCRFEMATRFIRETLVSG